MTNVLSRRAALGVFSSRLNSQQLQMDALTEDLSQQSSSGLLALAGASLLGRFVGLGCAGVGMRVGFSPLLTRGFYHASSLITEVGAYRSFSQGFGQAFERNGFVSDLLSFSVLRGAGILGQGRNIVAVHALQSGGAVLAQNLAYQAGWLQEAPQGTVLQQLIHSEFFNLKQNTSMGLMHLATGGRVLQIEKLQEAQLEAIYSGSRGDTHPQFFEMSPHSVFHTHAEVAQGHSGEVKLLRPRPLVTREGVEHPFELFLHPLRNLLNADTGTEMTIARREGREIRIRAKRQSSFERGGQRYQVRSYDLLENGATGFLRLYFSDEALILHSIHHSEDKTNYMPPGAGSVVIDWLARQAAIEGKRFEVHEIGNPRVIEILYERDLMDPRESVIEMGDMESIHPPVPVVARTISWSERENVLSAAVGNYEFVQVRGRPNPIIIAPEKNHIFSDPVMSLSLPRDFSPYKMGESFEVASGESNHLVARLSGFQRGLVPIGHTFTYYLNGEYVGYFTHQVDALARRSTIVDMQISPDFQGRGIGKQVALYEMYRAHVAGYEFGIDAIVNPKILAWAVNPDFHAGERMLEAGAQVQAMRIDEANNSQVIPVGEPVVAEKFYHSQTGIEITGEDFFRFYGKPNSKIFQSKIEVSTLPRTYRREHISQNGRNYLYELYVSGFPNANETLTIGRRWVGDDYVDLQVLGVPHKGTGRHPVQPEESQSVHLIIKERDFYGSATIYDSSDVISLHIVNTESLSPGAGSIFISWLATMAALQAKEFHILEIENPHIHEIMRRQRLTDPNQYCLEAGYRTTFGYDIQGIADFSDSQAVENILRQHMFRDFSFLRGKPHPDLATRGIARR